MALIPSGSTISQKAWRPGLVHEAERQAHMMGFVSPEDNSGIVLMEDLTKKRGDKIQVRFSPTDDSHDGFGEDDQVESNEELLEFFSDELTINYLAFAYRQPSQMSQQRVNFDLKAAAFIKLAQKWAHRYEEAILNQLCANTVQTNLKRTGQNAVTVIDANHRIDPVAGTDDDALVVGTGKMNLTVIDNAVLRMMSKSQIQYVIPPCPDGFYHMVMHPIQWRDLRANTSAGQWYDIVRAVQEGGKARTYEDGPLARGWLGVYNNVKLHVSDFIPLGIQLASSTTAVADVRRACLFGARAAHMAFGEGYADGNHLDWVEQVRNYKTWGVLADSVFGVKRTIFNGQTYGSLVVSTYAL